MSDAVALTSPTGIVYAYACGACHHIGGHGEMLIDHDAEAVARIAETSRVWAERCCKCDGCGLPSRRGAFLTVWSGYCDACAKVQQAKHAARQAEVKAEQEAEAATEQGVRDARDRAISEAFFDGYNVSELAERYGMDETAVAVAIRGWAAEILDV
jgi:hypothetical protein